MKLCECCNSKEGCIVDYRPKLDLLSQGSVFDYKTPLDYYNRYTVCIDCFRLENHKEFYKRVSKNEVSRGKVATS